jgi:apolipoprotein N-acyltransferase
MAVCMDVNFPAPTRNYADAGTQLIAIPAADEDVSGWQHSRTALLRGVENGLAVAWSAQRGTLMVSDPWGRVLADASTDAGAGAAFASTVADVRAGSGPTVYTRFGDWFVWLCIALTLSGLIGTAVPQNRRRTTEDPNSGVPDTAVALR